MPSPVRFAEIRRLLEKHGWTLARISGSHYIFQKPGHRSFPVPVHHGKVDYVYFRKAQKEASD
jgi:predicted RNA binding protein YcfA (HicA-like mRNA interferase family)